MAATTEIVQGIMPTSDAKGEILLLSPTNLLRSTLRQSYLEIDQLYTDVYLAGVLSQAPKELIIPSSSDGNDNSGIATKKIRESLQWRRDAKVDSLTSAFFVFDDDDDKGILRPTTTTTRDVVPPTTNWLTFVNLGRFVSSGLMTRVERYYTHVHHF